MGIRITVLGTGYLGTTHAAGMAELGQDVQFVCPGTPKRHDGRSALDPDGWRAGGWSYRALRRP